MSKKQLGPLIPLDDLKKVVRGLVAVPKVGSVKPKPRAKTRGKR